MSGKQNKKIRKFIDEVVKGRPIGEVKYKRHNMTGQIIVTGYRATKQFIKKQIKEGKLTI